MCYSSFSLFWVQLFVMSENTSTFTAYYYLKNDFVGQKFLEFILGQGMKVNWCWNKPGGHSVLQKEILGKVRDPWPPDPSRYHSPCRDSQRVSQGTKSPLVENHCADYPKLIKQEYGSLQSSYLRCYKVWDKWDFAILETDSLNTWDRLSWLCRTHSKAKYNLMQPHRGEQSINI